MVYVKKEVRKDCKMEDKIIRENMSMDQMSFYLDKLTKLKVLKRLQALGLDTKKGSISATIRVLLADFADSTDNSIAKRIQEEYLFTTTKNKRSTM